MNRSDSHTNRIAVFFIDTLCVFIPFLLFACFLLVAKPKTWQKNDTSLLYTITLPTVREEFIGGIHEDVPVLDAVSKRPIGQVVSYRVTPSLTQSYSKNAGHMRLVEYPGHVAVSLTIRAEGKETAGGYSLAGFTLFRGEQISLRLPNFVGTGTCTELTPLPLF